MRKEILKIALGLLVIFFSSACRTSYYTQHWFAEREYQPVKKGKLEMIIREKTFPVSSSEAISWQEAYNMGLKKVNQSIEHFCNGKYMIQKISEEKDKIGTVYSTSISDRSSYRGSPFFGNVYSSSVTAGALPLYKHYTIISFQCQ